MVNEDNEAVYCKFHYKTDQGIKCFDRSVTNVGASNDGDGFYSNLVVDTRRTKWPSKTLIMRSGVTLQNTFVTTTGRYDQYLPEICIILSLTETSRLGPCIFRSKVKRSGTTKRFEYIMVFR